MLSAEHRGKAISLKYRLGMTTWVLLLIGS